MVRAPDDIVYQYRYEALNQDRARLYAENCSILKSCEILIITDLGTERPSKLGQLIPFWR